MRFFDRVIKIIMDGLSVRKSYLRPQTPVGAGYYALKHNTSRAGVPYTKLVRLGRNN